MNREDRVKRAKQIFFKIQEKKEQDLKELLNSQLFFYTKIASGIFIFILFFIVLDLFLPTRIEKDVIQKVSLTEILDVPSQTNPGIHAEKEKYFYITTENNGKIEVEENENYVAPQKDEKIEIHYSLLLNKPRRIECEKRGNLQVSNSIFGIHNLILFLLTLFFSMMIFIAKTWFSKSVTYVTFVFDVFSIILILFYLLK